MAPLTVFWRDNQSAEQSVAIVAGMTAIWRVAEWLTFELRCAEG